MKMNNTYSITKKEVVLVSISVIAAVFCAGVVGYYLGANGLSSGNQDKRGLNIKDFKTAYSTIAANYDGSINEDNIVSGGIEGMVASLEDKNSFFLTAEEYSSSTTAHADPGFSYRNLNDTYSYLKIYQFTTDFERKFASIAAKIKDDKPKKLIIDLRDSPGGDGNSEVFLADQFLKKGVISEEKYKVEGLNQKYEASGKPTFPDLQLIILVNSQTASAAEIFAASLQDNKRGLIVGEKTYGKGTIGSYFELPNGSAIHITTGKWFKPSGTSIQNGGITPDYIVDDKDATNDEVLQKAQTL